MDLSPSPPPGYPLGAFFLPFDPATDDYDVPAFLESIRATKATAIYAMHSYHQGKKPHGAIRQYIRHYARPGEVVLDPFCGSGGTALAAVLEGRKAVALDRSPAAAFIARNYCRAADPAELGPALQAVADAARAEIDWLYETRCDRCGGLATTEFMVRSERIACPKCRKHLVLADCPAAEPATPRRRAAVCPCCLARGHVEPIPARGPKLGAVPILTAYRCAGDCRPAAAQRRHDDLDPRKRRYFRRYDLGKLAEIGRSEIPHWLPQTRFPTSFARWQSDLRGVGIRSVADLYTRRNLWALAALRAAAVASPEADGALFALTAVSLAASKMQRYSPRSGFPNMLLVGTYYIPPVGREIHVGRWYEGKIRALLRGYAAIRTALVVPPSGGIPPKGGTTNACGIPPKGGTTSACVIATGDARRLEIPSDSIDYIFTDPPYADHVQYGELNFVWESWLGHAPDWHGDEIVVNAARGKTEADWAAAMRQAIGECHRVLKPGRWLSLCYHDAAGGTWALLQDVMAEAGFQADAAQAALAIETTQKSFNQLMTDKATKRDLVVNFRKASSIRHTTPERQRGSSRALRVGNESFDRLARRIVRDYLAAHPGATKDRIYDDLVSRLVRRGRMQVHDFEALLAGLASEVRPPRRTAKVPASGRWYLKLRRKKEACP